MKNLGESVGQRVRAVRKARGLTQENLAEAAGVANETISRLERGTQVPRLGHLLAVAKALETTVGALVDGDDPPDRGALPPELNRLVHVLQGRSEDTQRQARQLVELALAMKD